jgi:hypothetical protein
MKGRLPKMEIAIKELEKNRLLNADFTYSCLLRGRIVTEDVWMSKLKNKDVHAVMFTYDQRILGIWDASIGELRPAGNPDEKYHFMSEEMYNKFKNK